MSVLRPVEPTSNRMIVFLNGRFIPEAQAVVPISDRGFLYGDGLFETIRVRVGRPLWWTRHMDRFERGASFLKLRPPWASDQIREFAGELIRRNGLPDSILRVTLSRGSGERGYSPRDANAPTFAVTLHPAPVPPSARRLVTVSVRIPANESLANFKTANKLVQVLARAEAEQRGADDALLLNTDGNVAEASASNIFWLENGALYTPPLADGALDGVTRSVVLELARLRNVRTLETRVRPEGLMAADGVFLTNSTSGIVSVAALDGRELKQSPFVAELQQWLEEAAVADAGS